MPAPEYKGCLKWLLYLVARALLTVLQRVPTLLLYRGGRMLGLFFYYVLADRRKVVRKNVGILNAWKEAQGVRNATDEMAFEGQVRELFMRNFSNLLCSFRLSSLPPEKQVHYLSFEGVEHLISASESGKGVIVLMAHTGPWEVLSSLGKFGSKLGFEGSTGAIYRPLNNGYLDDWYRSQRESGGARMFGRRNGLPEAIDFVRGGGCLGILSDQRTTKGEVVTYFGRQVKMSPLPYLLQRRTGCAMLGLSCETVGPARWRFVFRKIPIPAEGGKLSRGEYSQLVAEASEGNVSGSITDAFFIHNVFK